MTIQAYLDLCAQQLEAGTIQILNKTPTLRRSLTDYYRVHSTRTIY